MKSAIWLISLLLTGSLLLCACTPHQPSTTSSSASSTEEPSLSELRPAEGVLFYTRQEDELTVTVTLADAAEEEISLLLLTDPNYRYTWTENPDAYLLNLGQIKLDPSGNGSLIWPYDGRETAYLVLTASCGCYVLEVA